MLRSLYISNYAIIDEITISFSPRLNVITGETGAGKSILMGALSLILGDRADSNVLLDRSRKCVVEGIFQTRTGRLQELLRTMGLEEEGSGDELLIRREIAVSGKSRAFVNDIPVTLEQLRQVSSILVDLHRQFDTLALSDAGFQLNVLDALARNAPVVSEYREAFIAWKKSSAELNRLQALKTSSDREYDYQKFLFDELEQAAFAENELEDAEAELKVRSNAEGIQQMVTAAAATLTNAEGAVVQQLRKTLQQIDQFAAYHPALHQLSERLRSVAIETRDISDELGVIGDQLDHDPARMEHLNDRMSTGYKLLRKHGVQTTAALLEILEGLRSRLEAVQSADERLGVLEKEVAAHHRRITALAATVTASRAGKKQELEDQVNELLKQVGMPNARLRVTMDAREHDEHGADLVEFLFDANRSGRFEPLKKVASGGELSRLMLSIKSLVARSMDLPTLIFDEIDTGISGEAAKQVGQIMKSLAANRQVITITHQPQIAGKASAHHYVFKEARGEQIRTGIRLLSDEERIIAIAKMLGGEKPTAAALENAREMVMN